MLVVGDWNGSNVSNRNKKNKERQKKTTLENFIDQKHSNNKIWKRKRKQKEGLGKAIIMNGN